LTAIYVFVKSTVALFSEETENSQQKSN